VRDSLTSPGQPCFNVPLPDVDQPASDPPIRKLAAGEVKCRARLGGFLKHYDREAA